MIIDNDGDVLIVSNVNYRSHSATITGNKIVNDGN